MLSVTVCIATSPAVRAAASDADEPAGPDAVRRHLAAVKAVGAEGAMGADAARAWRALAEADAKWLPEILAAIDDAGPVASNWIRTAVDAIGDRALANGGTLPVKALEAFVRDTSHGARARRVAYEWLARVDETAPDRLIPGMLRDPGSAFRRDAVARLLTDGTRHLDAARKAYRKALSGAVDPDQVKQITEQLAKLGVEVDVPRHFGFILEWRLIGPFDNTDSECFDVVYPPEKTVDLKAKCPGKFGPVAWIDTATSDDYGVVNLNKRLGGHKDAIAYAFGEFTSKGAESAEIRIGTFNGIKLWLNGDLLFAHEEYHHGSAIDQYRIKAALRSGRNTMLLKISQNNQKDSWAQNWQFQLRVCDAEGAAVLSTTRPKRTKKAKKAQPAASRPQTAATKPAAETGP